MIRDSRGTMKASPTHSAECSWQARDSLASSSSHSVRLLILQPTPFCNIRCDYCYLADRDHVAMMSVETAEAAVRNVRESGFLGRDLSCIWHAGEPLVARKDFYRNAFERMSIVASGSRLDHSIQTNGLLIDDEWCSIFREFGVRVGVSLDGPAWIHDAHRRTRNGRPTHARVMKGIETLAKFQIPYHVIAVVTRDSLSYADEIMDFFLEHGIADVGFNIDEQEGVNTKSSLDGEDYQFSQFLRRVFNRTLRYADRIRVRESSRAIDAIANGLAMVELKGESFPDNAQILPFAITSVNWKGDFSCFSPELLDQIHDQYGHFVLGNVSRDSMLATLQSSKFKQFYGEILDGVRACRDTCEYFQLCGGGSPVNKLNENGTFATTETRYCRLCVQEPIRIALEFLEAL